MVEVNRRSEQGEGVLSRDDFRKVLPLICSRETSFDPENWQESNPLWGQCCVVAMLAQDLFGGELRRASLDGIAGFREADSHYWNRVDGEDEDFTASQFVVDLLPVLVPIAIVRERSDLEQKPEVMERYKRLRERWDEVLSWGLAECRVVGVGGR